MLGARAVGRSRYPGFAKGGRLDGAIGDSAMFDFGSIFDSVFASTSDLVVNQIVQMITKMLGGLLG